MRIAWAAAHHRTDLLSDRDRRALSIAADMARRAKQHSKPQAIARALCEMLNEWSTPKDDRSHTDQYNLFGVLLDRCGVCAGYTDAYYLAGTLAGLRVRYQVGASQRGGVVNGIDCNEGHSWNLIRLDSSWRVVDNMWNSCTGSLIFFNLGSDRAAPIYAWNRDVSLRLLHETPTEERPANEFALGPALTMEMIAQAVKRSGLTEATIVNLPEHKVPEMTQLLHAQLPFKSLHYSAYAVPMCLTVQIT